MMDKETFDEMVEEIDSPDVIVNEVYEDAHGIELDKENIGYLIDILSQCAEWMEDTDRLVIESYGRHDYTHALKFYKAESV